MYVQTLFRPAPVRARPVRTLRTLLATVGVATALAGAGQAQYHQDHGRPAMPAYSHGGPGFSPQRMPPQGYGHGGPAYGAQSFGAPPYAGGRNPETQRYPPRTYPPYQQPNRDTPAFGGEWREQQDFLRQGVRQGQLAPLGRVIANIREHTPGRQLDAGLEQMGPRLVYRVRWMTAQGRRVDYIVDAASGAIVSGR